MAFIRDSSRIDLHLLRTRAIHVVTAAITAKGDHMNTAIEESGTTQAAEKPKAGKKASAGQKRAHVGPAKGKVPRRSRPPRKRQRPRKRRVKSTRAARPQRSS